MPQRLWTAVESGAAWVDAVVEASKNKVASEAESLESVLEDLGDRVKLTQETYGAARDGAKALMNRDEAGLSAAQKRNDAASDICERERRSCTN